MGNKEHYYSRLVYRKIVEPSLPEASMSQYACGELHTPLRPANRRTVPAQERQSAFPISNEE